MLQEKLKAAEPGTDLLAAVERDSSVVLVNAEAFEAWLIDLRSKVDGLDSDVSIRKNREAIREAAAEVGRKGAAIERDRLRLTKEWRDMTAKVNEAGKDINEKLKSLQAEVRKPLTEWEEAERARVAECEAIIARLSNDGICTEEDTAATVRARGTEVYSTVIDPELFGDLYERAKGAQHHAVDMLKISLARLTQEEADRAELEELRAKAAERDRIEAERVAAEQEKQRQADAEKRAEEARIAAEKAAKEREEQIARDAATKAQREAEEKHAAELQAERDRAAKIERDAQAERDKVAAAERAREQALANERAEAARIAAEDAKRARNQAHRAQRMGEAKIAIMAAGSIDEATAILIVKAIVADRIPHVSLEF